MHFKFKHKLLSLYLIHLCIALRKVFHSQKEEKAPLMVEEVLFLKKI